MRRESATFSGWYPFTLVRHLQQSLNLPSGSKNKWCSEMREIIGKKCSFLSTYPVCFLVNIYSLYFCFFVFFVLVKMTNGHLLWQWQSLISALFSSTTFIPSAFCCLSFSLSPSSPRSPLCHTTRQLLQRAGTTFAMMMTEEKGKTMPSARLQWSCRWLFIIE